MYIMCKDRHTQERLFIKQKIKNSQDVKNSSNILYSWMSYFKEINKWINYTHIQQHRKKSYKHNIRWNNKEMT
jgi:hypothetical protein